MKEGHGEAPEAQLSAHRRVRLVLLSRVAPADRDAIVARLDKPFPPRDGKEDPSAAPREGLAAIAAYGAEMRVLRDAMK